MTLKHYLCSASERSVWAADDGVYVAQTSEDAEVIIDADKLAPLMEAVQVNGTLFAKAAASFCADQRCIFVLLPSKLSFADRIDEWLDQGLKKQNDDLARAFMSSYRSESKKIMEENVEFFIGFEWNLFRYDLVDEKLQHISLVGRGPLAQVNGNSENLAVFLFSPMCQELACFFPLSVERESLVVDAAKLEFQLDFLRELFLVKSWQIARALPKMSVHFDESSWSVCWISSITSNRSEACFATVHPVEGLKELKRFRKSSWGTDEWNEAEIWNDGRRPKHVAYDPVSKYLLTMDPSVQDGRPQEYGESDHVELEGFGATFRETLFTLWDVKTGRVLRSITNRGLKPSNARSWKAALPSGVFQYYGFSSQDLAFEDSGQSHAIEISAGGEVFGIHNRLVRELVGDQNVTTENAFYWSFSSMREVLATINSPYHVFYEADKFTWLDQTLPFDDLFPTVSRSRIAALKENSDSAKREIQAKEGNLYFLGFAFEDFREAEYETLEFSENDLIDLNNSVAEAGSRSLLRPVPILGFGNDFNREDAMERFSELIEITEVQDTVVISLATHGVRRNSGLYLVLPETRKISMADSGLEWVTLARFVQLIKAKRVIIFLDTCHAGSFGESHLEILDRAQQDLNIRPGLTVIASSNAGQTALELEDFQHGAFTQALLEVLPTVDFPHAAGKDYFDSLRHRVEELTNDQQSPVLLIDNPITTKESDVTLPRSRVAAPIGINR